jgi:hypothetical protein
MATGRTNLKTIRTPSGPTVARPTDGEEQVTERTPLETGRVQSDTPEIVAPTPPDAIANDPPTPASSSSSTTSVTYNYSVLICINGSPYWIDIPYDDSTGAYDGTGDPNYEIEEP